ncbi:MAG TPA: DegV family protein [Limnochordia bacterium]|nr:DegV family protein [Limnochordia bacterium]
MLEGDLLVSLSIVTDSACDLPESILKAYNIHVLPFLIYIDGKEYLDGVSITTEQVFAAIREGKVPSTGQVRLENFLQVFTQYAQEGRPCLFISVSSGFSGSHSSALLALEEVKRAYPEAPITVVDSQSASLGEGLIVLEAAEMAREGRPAAEIIERVQKRSQNNVEHIFSVDDLTHLYRGGRVKFTSAFLGSLLNVKPILHVQNGACTPLHKVRGRKMAVKRIVELVQERSLGHPDQLVGVAHSQAPGLAQELAARLRDQLGYRRFLIHEIGCSLGCHIGIGGVGALFVNSNYPQPNLTRLPET